MLPCDTNGYCGYHQPDTISYRHLCGTDSVCGCIPPGAFKQIEIENNKKLGLYKS